jgi:hypothetical protein
VTSQANKRTHPCERSPSSISRVDMANTFFRVAGSLAQPMTSPAPAYRTVAAPPSRRPDALAPPPQLAPPATPLAILRSRGTRSRPAPEHVSHADAQLASCDLRNQISCCRNDIQRVPGEYVLEHGVSESRGALERQQHRRRGERRRRSKCGSLLRRGRREGPVGKRRRCWGPGERSAVRKDVFGCYPLLSCHESIAGLRDGQTFPTNDSGLR